MKQNRFQTLFGLALGLALLAAFLFAVSAARKAKEKNLSEQKTEAEDSVENKEITLTIKGIIYGGEFIFEGNTIRFSNMMVYRIPEDITVDGKRWKNLTKPFKLGYTPDFAKAGILETSVKRYFYVDATETRLSLRFAIHSPRSNPVPFYVKLAMKDQLSHLDLGGYRPAPAKNDPPQVMTTGPDPYVAQAAEQWNDAMKDRRIEVKAVIRGRGAFVFEENTISYRHEKGDYPDSVKINGRRWTHPETKNFELPFQIETAHPEVVQSEGGNLVELTKIDDKKFEVIFDDSDRPSRTHSPVYTVTIRPGNAPKPRIEFCALNP
ncbi:MAG: hypothetical protein IK088_01985 [Lachnospiraceae bacterium]|nr:hypothetical protein [Lachnospiraceae bacterium]